MGILIVILLGSIATWRLTLMLQEETGPFALFEKLQMKINSLEYKPGGIRDGFNCFYCLSVWVAIFFIALLALLPILYIVLTSILTFSAVAIFLNIIKERNS